MIRSSNEIFVRIDMKQLLKLFVCNQFFLLLKLLLFNMFMNIFCSCGSYKEIESNKYNFVYVLVHRNILMYVILACHLFM